VRRVPWKTALGPALALITLAGLAHVPCFASKVRAQPTIRDAQATACSLLREASERAALCDLQVAEDRLHQAIELVPDWAPPRALLGTVHQMQGREFEAREQYEAHQFLALLAEGSQAGSQLLVETAQAEALLLYRTNDERLTRGLRPLLPSIHLATVARAHSREMRDMDYFSHQSPIPANATMIERFINVFGKQPRVLAENLSRRGGSLYAFTLDNIDESHQRLMNSPPHRKSILWEKITQIGIGIAVSERGDYWITESFASDCTPRQ